MGTNQVAMLQEGEVFGELSALGSFKASVTLQAYGVTTVREISCEYLKKVLFYHVHHFFLFLPLSSSFFLSSFPRF